MEQRTAEGIAAAAELSAVRTELEAARTAASEANAAVAALRSELDAAQVNEREQQRLHSDLQVRHYQGMGRWCPLRVLLRQRASAMEPLQAGATMSSASSTLTDAGPNDDATA